MTAKTPAQRQAKRRASGKAISVVLRDATAIKALGRLARKHGGITAAVTVALRSAEQ